MPSRWVCAAIVTGWLLTNGWLLWREVLPSWEPNQPPAISVDLVEEVQLDRHNETPWAVSVYNSGRRKWEKSYRARTWVEHAPEKDLFDLKMHLEALPPSIGEVDPATLVVRKVDCSTRVTSAGELRELSADASGGHSAAAYSFRVEGEVRDGMFRGNYLFRLPQIQPIKWDLTPTRVNYQGTIMLGIHPQQRLRGLRPGQTWKVPTLDIGRSGATVRIVRARVLAETDAVTWHNRDTACLVVEATGDEERTRTWVVPESGLVLKQETTFMEEHWMMQRER
jgi:hypothetical protein